jgi:hypothetical protein
MENQKVQQKEIQWDMRKVVQWVVEKEKQMESL